MKGKVKGRRDKNGPMVHFTGQFLIRNMEEQ